MTLAKKLSQFDTLEAVRSMLGVLRNVGVG